MAKREKIRTNKYEPGDPVFHNDVMYVIAEILPYWDTKPEIVVSPIHLGRILTRTRIFIGKDWT